MDDLLDWKAKLFVVSILGAGAYGLVSHALAGGSFSLAMMFDGLVLAEPLWWIGLLCSVVMLAASASFGAQSQLEASFLAVVVCLAMAGLGALWRSEDEAIVKFARLHKAAIDAGAPIRIDGLPLEAAPNARVLSKQALLALGVLDESGGKRSDVSQVKAVCAPACQRVVVWRGSIFRELSLGAE